MMPQSDNKPKGLSDILRYCYLVSFIILLLFFGQVLFIPMFYGLFIAMVMYPVCRWLEKKHITRGIAIGICLGIVAVLFLALVALLGWQVALFRQDIPELASKFRPMIPAIRTWLNDYLSITIEMQDEWLHKTALNMSGNAGGWLQATFSTLTGFLFYLFLVPVHAALFLYHRGMFVRFLQRIAGEKYRDKTGVILGEVIHTYFNYVKGMVLVYIIVGILNSIGLLALGIRHAILFGMMTAFMTIIPYVGIFISAALPVSVAFIISDSIWLPLGVVAVFSVVQYLEANVIFPAVVGTQLNVSTWATLVAIIAGGIIWGVSGMILFIPFVAILKIVTDHIKELDWLNILLNRDQS